MAKDQVTALLEGVPDLFRALELTNARTKANTIKAVEHGTRAVERRAHQKVPKRSGELDQTIRSEFTADGMVGYVKAGYGKLLRRSRSTTGDASGRYAKAKNRVARQQLRFRNAKTSKQALAASNLGNYGPVVERGDPRRKKPAQPYLNPALTEETPAIKRALADAPINAGTSAGLHTS